VLGDGRLVGPVVHRMVDRTLPVIEFALSYVHNSPPNRSLTLVFVQTRSVLVREGVGEQLILGRSRRAVAERCVASLASDLRNRRRSRHLRPPFLRLHRQLLALVQRRHRVSDGLLIFILSAVLSCKIISRTWILLNFSAGTPIILLYFFSSNSLRTRSLNL